MFFTFSLFLQPGAAAVIPASSAMRPPIGSVHAAGGGRRPVKVWSANRAVRKAIVVATYEEFQRKAREKLGLGKTEPVRIVLEADGTLVSLLIRLSLFSDAQKHGTSCNIQQCCR